MGPITTTRGLREDRKSTRLNSSHDQISYAVFCLKKKMPARRYAQADLALALRQVSSRLAPRGRLDGDAVASCVVFNDTATTAIYTLSLHDALPITTRGLR